jgi:hypothetical protein
MRSSVMASVKLRHLTTLALLPLAFTQNGVSAQANMLDDTNFYGLSPPVRRIISCTFLTSLRYRAIIRGSGP